MDLKVWIVIYVMLLLFLVSRNISHGHVAACSYTRNELQWILQLSMELLLLLLIILEGVVATAATCYHTSANT